MAGSASDMDAHFYVSAEKKSFASRERRDTTTNITIFLYSLLFYWICFAEYFAVELFRSFAVCWLCQQIDRCASNSFFSQLILFASVFSFDALSLAPASFACTHAMLVLVLNIFIINLNVSYGFVYRTMIKWNVFSRFFLLFLLSSSCWVRFKCGKQHQWPRGE